MGLLRVVATGNVYFNRHRAVPEEFHEGLTFVGLQTPECFLRIDFHA